MGRLNLKTQRSLIPARVLSSFFLQKSTQFFRENPPNANRQFRWKTLIYALRRVMIEKPLWFLNHYLRMERYEEVNYGKR